MIGVVILCVLIVVVVGVILYDLNHIKTVIYEVKSEKCTKNMRLVLLADLHNHSFGKENEILIRKIDELHPDGILIAGDLMVKKKGYPFENAISLLKGIAQKYPVYYAPGNHETKIDLNKEKFQDQFEQYQKALDEIPVHMLRNESVYLEDANIEIQGLELPLDFFGHFKKVLCDTQDLTKCIGTPRKDRYQLLIAHSPEHFLNYQKWGADLVVSGHQHGGIVRLPLIGGVISTAGEIFPKYDGGIFEEKDCKMIISRGLGTHTIPVRFFNPCELVVIELKAEK